MFQGAPRNPWMHTTEPIFSAEKREGIKPKRRKINALNKVYSV
jgi:hypothetical protein